MHGDLQQSSCGAAQCDTLRAYAIRPYAALPARGDDRAAVMAAL
jgi:hypothetical protein